MADAPILFVAGFGRCGTTMMMTMLDAGGFPVTGPRPSYELPAVWKPNWCDTAWVNGQGGKAVKWIDPLLNLSLLEKLDSKPVVILMTRDAREQAKSQIKLLSTFQQGLGRRECKAMERSLRQDEPKLKAKLLHKVNLYIISFEDALAHPFIAASALEMIVSRHFGATLDVDRAASVVLPRDPTCRADLSVENVMLPLLAEKLGRAA